MSPWTIKLHRGSEARWIEVNPVLADGEAGVEWDTDDADDLPRLKFGDGATAWVDLPYFGEGTDVNDALIASIILTGTLTPAAIADLPVSGAVQSALDGLDTDKADKATTYTKVEIDGFEALDEKIANKGQALGYPSLDGGGKIPASQLPSSVMDFKGTWNVATNTPALADGTGDSGDIYLVSVGGTRNLGSGNITFDVGDWAVYSGTVWQRSDNSDAVVSVAGLTGPIAAAALKTALGFVQDAASTDLGVVLSDNGLRVAGSAYPITTSGPVFFNGRLRLGYITQTANVTLTTSSLPYNMCDASAGAFNVTLTPTTAPGVILLIKKVDSSANAVSILGTIDGQTNYVLRDLNDWVEVVSTAVNGEWKIVGLGRGNGNMQTTQFRTPQTNTPYVIPVGAKSLFLRTCGSGSGGGSGRRGAAGEIRCGGGSGGGGALSELLINVADLTALGLTTLYLDVAAGGVGGDAPTTDNTNGNPGSIGASSAIKTSATGASATNVLTRSQAQNTPGGGGGLGVAGAAGTAGIGKFFGIAGLASLATGVTTPGNSSSTSGGAPGGGSGCGLTAANVQGAGGVGGYSGSIGSFQAAAGIAGGGNGANGFTPVPLVPGFAGGGGGSNATGGGGRGGDGTVGAGGGGGGAGLNGFTGGRGGNGGDGFVEITAYF